MGALLALLAAAAAPAQPSPAALRYKAALAPVANCRAFARGFAALPTATPLLRTLFDEGIPQQAPGETGEDFVGRIVDRMFQRLGDPSRVYVSVPLDRSARYDFARGLLVVTFPIPYEATLDSTPPNGGGELRGLFEFPAGALPDKLELKMTPAESWRFRTGGGRLQIVALIQDYGTEPSPDPARPGERRLVRLTPKCALVGNGRAIVPGWSYDAWDQVSAE